MPPEQQPMTHYPYRLTAVRFLIVAIAAIAIVPAQTRLDPGQLRQQNTTLDFGSALKTRPVKVGTSIPSTCEVGYLFFKSDAPAGANLYGCTATNTWTLLALSGEGGAAIWGAIAGTLASQTDLQNALNAKAASSHTHAGTDIASGTLPAARLPNPSAGALGGVRSLACSGTDKISSIGTDGIPVCSADQTGGGGGAADGPYLCAPAGGSGTTYTCTIAAVESYASGLMLVFKPDTASTGAATVNVSSLGAKSITRKSGNAVASGELASGRVYLLTYNGTAFELPESDLAIGTGLTSAFSLGRSGGQTVLNKEAGLCLAGDPCAPGGAWDFSGSAATSPFRIGTEDPATCDDAKRQWFYNSGSNTLKVCNATNTWSSYSSGGGGSSQQTLLHQSLYSDTTGDGTNKTLVTYSMPGGTVASGDIVRVEAFLVRVSGAAGDDPVFSVRFADGGAPGFGVTVAGDQLKYETEIQITSSTAARINGMLFLRDTNGRVDLAGNSDAISTFAAASSTTIALTTTVAIPDTVVFRVVYFRVWRIRL